MIPKVTLEGRLLKVRECPSEIHLKIEEFARTQGAKRKMTITKERATIELLEKATKNIRL